MADGADGFVRRLKDVDPKHGAHLPELRPAQRQEVPPVRELVADKPPVDPEREVEEKHVGRGEVDETGDAKPVAERRLARARDRRRMSDEQAGDDEHQDTEGVEPMVETHGQFPDVDALEHGGLIRRGWGSRRCSRSHGRSSFFRPPGWWRPRRSGRPGRRRDGRRRRGRDRTNARCAGFRAAASGRAPACQ